MYIEIEDIKYMLYLSNCLCITSRVLNIYINTQYERNIYRHQYFTLKEYF